jgi:hypothetical protein
MKYDPENNKSLFSRMVKSFLDLLVLVQLKETPMSAFVAIFFS